MSIILGEAAAAAAVAAAATAIAAVAAAVAAVAAVVAAAATAAATTAAAVVAAVADCNCNVNIYKPNQEAMGKNLRFQTIVPFQDSLYYFLFFEILIFVYFGNIF